MSYPNATQCDAAQAHHFLDLLHKTERDTRIRAISHKGAIKGSFSFDLINAVEWNKTHNIYCVINNGGDTSDSITSCPGFI